LVEGGVPVGGLFNKTFFSKPLQCGSNIQKITIKQPILFIKISVNFDKSNKISKFVRILYRFASFDKLLDKITVSRKIKKCKSSIKNFAIITNQEIQDKKYFVE